MPCSFMEENLMSVHETHLCCTLTGFFASVTSLAEA